MVTKSTVRGCQVQIRSSKLVSDLLTQIQNLRKHKNVMNTRNLSQRETDRQTGRQTDRQTVRQTSQ